MSVEQNKTIVRRIYDEVWGKGQTALLSEFYTRDICDHLPMPGQPRGVEGVRWFTEMMRQAIPDMRVTLNRVIGEGDLVADYWTATGTHKGEMMGMPATNKKFTISGSTLARFTGGKISEMWALGDNLGMMQQLGLAPVPEGIPQEAGRPTGSKTSSDAGRGSFTPDQRRDTIRRAYQEFIDKRNLTNLDQFLTPDFVGHFSAYPTVYGHDEFRKYVGMYNQGFPTMHAKLEQIIVDGDYAACLVRFNGRHTGNLGELGPTNKEVDNRSISLFHFVGDRVNEQWATNDDTTLMQQLGVIPAPQFETVPC
jgi:steroid delta-isomerase-like uncharacterized protein